jgi:hypothetical protein
MEWNRREKRIMGGGGGVKLFNDLRAHVTVDVHYQQLIQM